MDIILFLLPLDNVSALYAVLFGLIFVAGFGAPIPEEITLLLAGYLSYLGFTDFFTTVGVLSMSIVTTDFVSYLLGRYAGDFLYEKILGHFEFTRELLEKAKIYFDRFGERVILVTRPIVGVRFVVPIMAGHFRMNIKKFVAYDCIAAVPYTLILISLSYYLGSVFTLIADFRFIKHIIGWTISGIIVLMLIWQYIKKRRRGRQTSH